MVTNILRGTCSSTSTSSRLEGEIKDTYTREREKGYCIALLSLCSQQHRPVDNVPPSSCMNTFGRQAKTVQDYITPNTRQATLVCYAPDMNPTLYCTLPICCTKIEACHKIRDICTPELAM
jgi:hypothetical protein